MLIVGYFNLVQMLLEHVAKVNPLIQNFNLSQRSQYSTHIHGGILDLVFDTSKSSAVSFLPSPFSDHFVLFSKSDALLCTEFSCKKFSFQFPSHNSYIL